MPETYEKIPEGSLHETRQTTNCEEKTEVTSKRNRRTHSLRNSFCRKSKKNSRKKILCGRPHPSLLLKSRGKFGISEEIQWGTLCSNTSGRYPGRNSYWKFVKYSRWNPWRRSNKNLEISAVETLEENPNIIPGKIPRGTLEGVAENSLKGIPRETLLERTPEVIISMIFWRKFCRNPLEYEHYPSAWRYLK